MLFFNMLCCFLLCIFVWLKLSDGYGEGNRDRDRKKERERMRTKASLQCDLGTKG